MTETILETVHGTTDGRVPVRLPTSLPARGGGWARWTVTDGDGTVWFYGCEEDAIRDQDGSLALDLE
jgi:hypothetical protein